MFAYGLIFFFCSSCQLWKLQNHFIHKTFQFIVMYFITTIQKRKKKKYRLNGNYFSFRNEYRRLRAGTGQFIQHCFGQLCQQPSLPAWRLWQTKFKVMSRNMVFQLAKLACGCSTLLFFFNTQNNKQLTLWEVAIPQVSVVISKGLQAVG